MAKEVLIHVWCDAHSAREEKVPGSTFTVALGGKNRVIDLCETCEKELISPLAQLLDEFGAPPEVDTASPAPAPKKRVKASPSGQRHEQIMLTASVTGIRHGRTPDGPRDAQCLWCPMDYAGGSGFLRHLKVVHGFQGLGEALGTTCPVCGKEGMQALGAHLVRAHKDLNFAHPTQAFVWAKEHGDPHGALAAALQRQGSLIPEEEWTKRREREATWA